MARASDLLVAEIALRSRRATEADLAECFAQQATQASEGRVLSLGQLLIKKHKLGAEEFLEVTRRLDEPMLVCLDCGALFSVREVEAGPEGKCRKCGNDMDAAAAIRGLPDEALKLGEGGPITRRTAERKIAPTIAPAAKPAATSASSASTKPDAAGAGRGAVADTGARAGILAGGEKAQGRRFGRYEILATIGVGGMGVVYKARQLDLDRVIALKVLREGEGARDEQVERFRREAQAAAKLQHPNIVAIHEVGLEEGIHYFTMDFVEGETLHDKLRRGELSPPRDAARLLATIAHAVHYAHRHGIVHRDLKPGNIILTPEGVPKITDFGLAKTMAADSAMELTRSGVAIGTPLYMSPEQVKGDLRAIDGRSDVFSLGTLLYQSLTGLLPFLGESHVELYNKILYEEPEEPRRILPAIPKDLQTVCLKALEKRPADRYQTAKDLADDLERAARGEATLARPPGPVERIARAASRHRSAVLVAATALLVAVVGWSFTVSVFERRRAREEADRRAHERAEAGGLLAEVAAAVRDGRPRDALARAAVLHARFPDSEEVGEARLLEGAASLSLGKTRDALGAYARAYRRGGGDAERVRALSAMADAFIAARDHDRALACLAKLLERYPASGEAARAELKTGKLLAELDDPKAAREHLKAAMAWKLGVVTATGEVEQGTENGERGTGNGERGTDSKSRAEAGLSEGERRDAEDTLRWLDDLEKGVEIPGAEAGTTGTIDGHPVLLLVRQGVLVALGPGPEGLVEIARFSVAGPRDAILDLAAGDVDGDLGSEVIVAYRDPDEGAVLKVVKWRPGPPAGFAVTYRARLEGRVARGGIAVGDIDGDGRGDIVIASAAGPGGAGGGVHVLRSVADGIFQPIPLAGDPAARGAQALAVCVADLDKDGLAEVAIGTGGGAGDDVRIYKWNAGAGGLDVEWRQKVGPVVALLATDFDADGSVDLALGRSRFTPGYRRDDHFLPEGLYVFRAVEPVKSYSVAWRDAVDPATFDGVRVRSLAAGDLTPTGGQWLIALTERTPGPDSIADPDRMVRTISVYRGFGREVVRRDLVFRDRAVEWVRTADLDSDGDAELIVGGPQFVKIYGLRGKR